MGRFITEHEPIGRYSDYNKDIFLLSEPVIYQPDEKSDFVIYVEPGFETDWASIPRISQLIISKSVGRRPFVIHDKLYDTLGLNGLFTRKQCDNIMLQAMTDDNMRPITRRTIYNAVRLGGWVPWNKIKRRNEGNEDE